ncbi:hypothetical protein [Catellatospora tritici]|uniref:hypothetical protein n=1 Tax=Catellatospora tritici TaxID=2851566 RepID=UPI001C2CE611|nr:hypothetical protein [Catellatospora tritici]MBV1854363.1 hypothetical protein [Catellatospora tritici]
MTAPSPTAKPGLTVEEKVKQLRELFADAPEIGKQALENVIPELDAHLRQPEYRVESAGRAGVRVGKVSELTIVFTFAPGGAKRLRALLKLLEGNFEGAAKVGSLHDMRFVFLDNDTRLLFCTTFDGDWDTYIDDFATKIPDYLDILDCCFEDWPGIRSPGAKDYLAARQINAEGWYVAHPDLTVAQISRLKKIGDATEEFLDKIGD